MRRSGRNRIAVSSRVMIPVVLLAAAACISPALAEPTSAVIRIDVAGERHPVSPMLHGIFLEEISHAFDGGLYAEMVMNRSFEEGVLPPGMKLVKQPDGRQKMELVSLPPGVPEEKWPMPWPWGNNCYWDTNRALIAWSLDRRGGAQGAMELTDANPMNAASSRSLALDVDASGADAAVALINAGYWGMSVRSGVTYNLAFHLRPGSFTGTVAATLEDGNGRALARHDFGPIASGDTWTSLRAGLAAQGTDPKARLVLAFHGRGRLQVDWVSLFPPTFRGRPNGLRPDLAQYLADLKPAFVRYPGGCYVEGLSWESAPDWRTMVCPPEERPGQWGYWQYRSTDGFGYHEFLQFCEDIGAAPLYVAFCGMTVHPENNLPLDRIGPVIQQALDAIEYANGPVTSKWGAVRARMGHPEPFNLRLIEIGNEHPPAVYGDYYVRFREAIKAKHPDVTVIMSMFWSGLNHAAIDRAGDANIDMVDEHAYRDAGWIRQNFDYFDRYPRKGWSVYVGEYASHHGGGDWRCALGDALYLMMCERNGDLVKMASYAPLFVNVNKRDWGINLIEFDAARSFAHASYYVQKVFAENRPDVNLASSCDVFPKSDPEKPLLAGRIGLGSWNTQVEFKDLEVTDSNGWKLAAEKFQSLENWSRPGAGAWSVEEGVLHQADARMAPAKLVLNTVALTTGTIRVKARRTGGAEGFLLFFNVRDDATFCFANVGGFGNTRTVMEYRGESPDGILRPGLATEGALENGRWYDVELKVGRDGVQLFLDGKKTADAVVADLPALFTHAGYDRRNRRVVLKAANYGRRPVTADIRLDGARDIAEIGRHIVIRSDDLHVDNSLEQPLRIIPVERPLANCGPRFSVTLPPASVNVLSVPCTAGGNGEPIR